MLDPGDESDFDQLRDINEWLDKALDGFPASVAGDGTNLPARAFRILLADFDQRVGALKFKRAARARDADLARYASRRSRHLSTSPESFSQRDRGLRLHD